jgi:hypothetical protein
VEGHLRSSKRWKGSHQGPAILSYGRHCSSEADREHVKSGGACSTPQDDGMSIVLSSSVLKSTMLTYYSLMHFPPELYLNKNSSFNTMRTTSWARSASGVHKVPSISSSFSTGQPSMSWVNSLLVNPSAPSRIERQIHGLQSSSTASSSMLGMSRFGSFLFYLDSSTGSLRQRSAKAVLSMRTSPRTRS